MGKKNIKLKENKSMAMFGKNNKSNEISKGASSHSNSTTIITGCMRIKGNIEGCGTIHIDGHILGDLSIDENIIIGASGTVQGNIKAKKIVISGKVKGNIICDTLEVTKTGTVSDKIHAKNIVADGTLDATILADEHIHITQNAKVTTERIQTKHISVNGHIDGNVIASELLEINKDGQVKGTMKVKKIKVSEGGLMLGTMLTYETSDSIKPENKIQKKEEVDKK